MFGNFLITFLVFAVVERWYERRFSHVAVRGERKMAWSYSVLHPLHIAIFIGTGVEYFWLRREVMVSVMAVGLGMYAVALTVRVIAIRTLGRYWSLHLEIREEHQLVTSGIYRYMRHPAYAAIMLEVVAIPLVGNSFYTLLISVVAYIPILLTRWRLEEREMIGKFGAQYERYVQEVSPFFPWRRLTRRGPPHEPSADICPK